jgi:hypothetical protein
MKTKQTKKSKTEQPVITHKPFPDPQILAADAESEPRVIAARDYIDTINTLRDKKSFSFQEIADWLHQRGVALDKHEVYRAYMTTIHPDEKAHMAHMVKLPDPED